MRLNTLTHAPEGAEIHPPLVVAHGLFGSARNWGGVAKRLAQGRRVVAVDMRNHGESPWSDEMTYPAMAADLAEALADAAGPGGEADLLGHSMGGKAAMACALTQSPPLRRLIVADVAPVPYRHSHAGYVAAMQGIDLGALTRRSEAEALLAPHVPDRSMRAFLLHSLANSPEGLRWRLNLDALADGMAGLVDWPAPDARWQGPALFLAGGKSGYLTEAHHAGVRALFPAARFETIPGADHWLHADAPEEFAAICASFLGAPEA
ncbi:MAG: alpha/beta fold hydrolase [Pseudomonadota bacterium]|nr:alpha/beta fold hydrolase [Pseudomonadota bacterium]